MKIGYGRVSTHEQNLDLQNDALVQAGCEKIFSDTITGTSKSRPGLDDARSHLRAGDTLIVWRLDRLGRSLKDLIEWITWFEDHGIGFISLQENMDTTTSTGKLVFHIFGAIAEFERNLIRERTQAGLAAARARGKKGGRKKALDDKQQRAVVELYNAGKHSATEICEMYGISRPTLYSYLKS
ncbi:MAG: recombinase family protein [Gammaproteobacteria bacterium]|nr:recombinase family protein [Gammaproteobacteria bacterium]